MKKISVLIPILLILTIGIVCSAGCVSEKENYVVGIGDGLPPFSSKSIVNGEPEGFDIDMLEWIAKDQGISFTYEYTNIADFMEKVDDDIYDLNPSVIITEERKEKVAFTDPYIEAKYVIVARKDSGVTKDEFLNGMLKVSFGEGSAYITWMKYYFGEEKFNEMVDSGKIILKETVDESIKSIFLEGQADATLCSDIAAFSLTKDYPPIQVIDYVDGAIYSSIAVVKSETELLKKLNAGIANFKASPEYKEYLDKYNIPYQKDVYNVGIDSNNAPFTYLDANGDLTGFDYEALMWIADKYGFKVNFVDSTEDKSVTDILNEKYDMWYSGYEYPYEPSNLVTLSEPYTVGSTEYVVEIHNGDIVLQDIINKGLALLVSEGKYGELIEKYNL